MFSICPMVQPSVLAPVVRLGGDANTPHKSFPLVHPKGAYTSSSVRSNGSPICGDYVAVSG